MKSYIYNPSSTTLNLFTYKIFPGEPKQLEKRDITPAIYLAQIIASYSLQPGEKTSDNKKFIYDIFSDIKIKYKDSEWIWEENWEHYDLTPILSFLNQIWNDLDIKKELTFITSDIHNNYSDIFPYANYHFTLHNMRLHQRMVEFLPNYKDNFKYRFFVQGGGARADRTYMGEQFQKYIPQELYISTISKNPHQQGADSTGKMKYTYSEMFELIHDSNILIVNETIRPAGIYYNSHFEGTASGYTEKTGNAIVFKKPFFLNSNPFSLYNLRELGFKTFGEIWDESYDEKVNQIDRIDAIIENIKWLSKIGDGGFNKLNRKLKDITEYNYKHLTQEMTSEDGLKIFKSSEFNFKL